MIADGAGRVYPEIRVQTFLPHQSPEHALRCRTAADIPRPASNRAEKLLGFLVLERRERETIRGVETHRDRRRERRKVGTARTAPTWRPHQEKKIKGRIENSEDARVEE